ncbi:GNAT family acetyltransferas-like protein [Tothia fuscella]|uniref:GNAT family acetyltransferas-like protein n=1 Tax=Tothia fuscella TaxID=1048955 RepID=A0A9P4NU84_9PEZI|nr:GNAT family acetyltransferas-like protein [Tothia fuscella]
MEQTLVTARLKLTLVTTCEDGSQDLEWVHKIRSDLLATSWSILGPSKSMEDTKTFLQNRLPLRDAPDDDKRKYRVTYIVHKLITGGPQQVNTCACASDVIGTVSLSASQTVPLPKNFTVSGGLATGILTLETGYAYLPSAWSHEYATEALSAMLDAFKKAKSYWAPYKKVYIEGICSPDNPASARVLEKAGLEKIGLYEWEGDNVFLAGAWRECCVNVYGIWLVD